MKRMCSMKQIFIIIPLMLCFLLDAGAQTKNTKKFARPAAVKSYDFKNYPLLEITKDQMQEWTKKMDQDTKREPAQVSSDGLSYLISKDLEFKKFKDTYLGLDLASNPLLIETFIDDYMTKIKEKSVQSNNVKFIVAQMQIFKAFRSFLYRVQPYLSQTKMTNRMLLSVGYNMNHYQKTYFNNKQSAGIFKYISEPLTADDVRKEIKTAQQFHDFLYFELYKHLQIASDMLIKLASEDNSANSTVAIYDNQLVFLNDSFQDGIEQYKAVGRSEIYALASSLESAMSQIAFSVSYNFEGMDKIAVEIGRIHGGLDSNLFKTEAEGLHAKKKRELMMKPEYASFLTLKPQVGDSLSRSYIHLQRSIDLAESSWNNLNAQKNKKSFMFNYAIVEPYKSEGSLTVAKWKEIVKAQNPVLIRSAVTGVSTRIQINSLFSQETAIKDLKSLLPVAFNTANGRTIKKKFGAGEAMVQAEYRNFNYGAAEAWNLDVYKKIFPDLKNNADVPAVANILSTAWGTAGAIVPFEFVLN